MPSPLVAAMAGAYTVEYAPPAAAPGYTTPETESGYGAYLDVGHSAVARVYERTGEFENVISDYWGQGALLDGVLQGFSHVLNIEKADWTANVRAMLFPWGKTAGGAADWGVQPIAGTLLSSRAGLLRMTAATGTPAAAANGPATFIAKLAIISPRTNHRLAMGSVWRRMPIQMLLLPYFDGTNYRAFAVT